MAPDASSRRDFGKAVDRGARPVQGRPPCASGPGRETATPRPFLHEADNDDATAGGDESDRLLHHSRDSGRLDDDRHALAVRQPANVAGQAPHRGQRTAAEAFARCRDVRGLTSVMKDSPHRPARPRRWQVRSGPRRAPGRDRRRLPAAPAGLNADRDRLGERGLEIRDACRDRDAGCAAGAATRLREAAVAMDADDAEIGAAVALADPAGIAAAAADERARRRRASPAQTRLRLGRAALTTPAISCPPTRG